jgi:hypothetical protein
MSARLPSPGAFDRAIIDGRADACHACNRPLKHASRRLEDLVFRVEA